MEVQGRGNEASQRAGGSPAGVADAVHKTQERKKAQNESEATAQEKLKRNGGYLGNTLDGMEWSEVK